MSKKVLEQSGAADPVSRTLHAVKDAGFGSLVWMGPAWVEAMSGLSSEVLSFFADRVREDAKTQHQLLHCKTFQDVQAVQAKFMERAYQQYTDETGKMIEKGSELFGSLPEKAKSTPI
jgi:hypothetical protein